MGGASGLSVARGLLVGAAVRPRWAGSERAPHGLGRELVAVGAPEDHEGNREADQREKQ